MNNTRLNRARSASVLALAAGIAGALGGHAAFAADYTFAVEPDYPPDRIQEAYKPLMVYLEKATGEHFTLQAPRNYHFYFRDLQAGGKTDFAFDEAHFTDYRIKRAQYEPLARSAEPTSYSLVTNLDVGKAGVNGLVGHSIATMSAPSLGYSLLVEFYQNPVSQPDIRSSSPSWKDAVEAIFAGDADGAIIPTSLKDQYPNVTVIKTSRQFAGQCVSAAASVPAEVKAKVRDALLKLDTDADASKLLLDLGISKFVPATAKEYDGAEQALKSYFGYK
jgi:ABC-type phosphate/phosphonate transport system substrate-binding protein